VSPEARSPSTRKASAKQVATAYFAAMAKRDVEAMMELWEPGAYGHMYGMASLRAPDGYRQWFGNMLFRAFPDFATEVVDIVAYGEKAAVRWRSTGTFAGPESFVGLEPNGARVEFEGLDLLTIRDGLIRENRAYTNGTEIARQLGAMPTAGSIGEKAMLGAVNLRTRAQAFLKRA
jgi:predicted ester cyclase